MNHSRHLRLWICASTLALVLGCAAKKTGGPPMPPVQAPAPASTPETTPEPTPSPEQAQLPNQGTPPPEPEQSPSTTANNKKPSPAKRATPKKTPTPTTQAKNSRVIHSDDSAPPNGGTISPQPSPVAPNEPTTEQLLQSTENCLNGLNRQLSAEEQEMVTHIRDYITQSRNATKDNDVLRSHNFASKAHQLCDDLLKRH